MRMNVVQPCITVASHITSDVSQPALYLTAKNGQKYLIGRTGEGLQRSMFERKFRTSRFSGLFLTGDNHWSSVSGLPGMLLSFSERGIDIDKLHTGSGAVFNRAKEVIDSWRHFKFHKSLQIQPESSDYTDENLTVVPFVFKESTSFVIQMKPPRGTFMVENAKALGVPAGTLFGKLSNGESVVIPGTDRVIHSSDVVGPAPTPARILVLDLPTMGHLKEALNHCEAMKETINDEEYDLRVIYYFLQEEVDLKSQELQSLVSNLSGNKTRNFISHPATSPNLNTLVDFVDFQSVFRTEFPEHFTELMAHPARMELPKNLKNCELLLQMHSLSIAPTDKTEPGAKKRVKALQLEYEPSNSVAKIDAAPLKMCSELNEAEIYTLGTGASMPSKYRNVAGTLVRSPEIGGSIIFDSGEATFNFMTRVFGYSGASRILDELRVLYISHMHADHHLGALNIIKTWLSHHAKTAPHKLVLACPQPFIAFIKEWAAIDGFLSDLEESVFILDLDTVCIGDRYSSDTRISANDIEKIADTIGFRVATCTALHNCTFSYNGTISSKDWSFKASYSGDSKPNRFFARTIGADSDVLIHEATHENELEQTANLKGHSTIGGALEIAKLMRAKSTILTHISQRYPKLPILSTDDAACFGFDGMRTKMSQISGIQQMVPRMSEILEEFESKNLTDSDQDM